MSIITQSIVIKLKEQPLRAALLVVENGLICVLCTSYGLLRTCGLTPARNDSWCAMVKWAERRAAFLVSLRDDFAGGKSVQKL